MKLYCHCFHVESDYVPLAGVNEFPIPSILSSWFTRAQQLLVSAPQLLSDGTNFVNLAKVLLANARDRIGLVTSQVPVTNLVMRVVQFLMNPVLFKKSQAHAINECIAKLRQGGPTCHIIAHVNGNSVLDLSVLLTGN